MRPYAYDRLSFLDNSFLITESPTNHMHIAGTATYEAGPLRRPDGGIDVDRVRDYVASRLHLIPRYRQVLAWTPIEGHPVWVDDEHFHIDYHLRHTRLPRPAPTGRDLLWAEVLRRASMPFELLRGFRRFLAEAEDPRSDLRAMLRAARDTVRSTMRQVSDTPLNQQIGSHRRFDCLAM